MNYRIQTNSPEERIRARSYLIWEREGCPEGKSEEHWLLAKAELEAEFEAECAACLDGKSTTFVVPLPLISSPPTRSSAVERNDTSASTLPRAA